MGVIRKTLVVGVVGIMLSVVSCGGGGGNILLGALIYNEFIKKDSNYRLFTGLVTDDMANALEGFEVVVNVDRPEPLEDEDFSTQTDENGNYKVSVPYFADARYTVSVLHGGVVLVSTELGFIAKEDQKVDLVVPSSLVGSTVSGKVIDGAGNELPLVLVSIAIPDEVGGSPASLITSNDQIRYLITNASGVYLFDQVVGEPLLVIGFNPDYGFGYLLIESVTLGSPGGDLVLPGVGEALIKVKIIDEAGNSLDNHLLKENEKFNLVLEPAFDFSAEIGLLVENEGLFSGMSKELVTALHPSKKVLEVRSTTIDGLSEQEISITAGLYKMSLISPFGQSFDGLILDDNPKLFFPDETVQILIKIATD